MTNSTTKKETVYTTYAQAVHWLDSNLIMCNNIGEIDPTIYENCRFSDYDEETGTVTEIFQYFLTSLSESEVEWLEEKFDDMLFTYSNLLDMYVLCVDHLGTRWDYVHCEVIDDNMKEIVIRQKRTYKDLTGQDF